MSKEGSPDKLNYAAKYDYEKIGDIVESLQFLKEQAKKTGDEDIIMIINSAFNLCFSAYYLSLRDLRSRPNDLLTCVE